MTLIKSCDIHKSMYYRQCRECKADAMREEKAEKKADAKRAVILAKQKAKAQEPRVKPKKVSDKMKEALKEYKPLRKKYLAEHPECEMRLIGCEGMATDIHHTASRGINLNNVSTWKSACRECHMKLHNELSAEEVRELGLKTSAINQERQTI